jgi:MFS family permease
VRESDARPRPEGQDAPAARVHLLTGALAITVFFGFGLLVFAIAIVLPEMMAELGWSNGAVSMGLTIGLLSAGFAAPAAGAIIDRFGGRIPMAIGTVATSTGITLWSLVTTYPMYIASWLVMGAGMTFVLYEAAFTAMVRHAPARRRQGLLVISFLGAVSSTAFMPVIELLVRANGWRQALLVLAIVNLIVVTPLILFAIPHGGTVLTPERAAGDAEGLQVSTEFRSGDGQDSGALASTGSGRGPGLTDPHATPRGGSAGSADVSMLRDRVLRRIGFATLLGDAPVYAVSVHIVAYLIVTGRSTAFAATMGALVGVAKLAGRVGVGLLVRRVGSYRLFVSAYLLVGVGLSLPLLPVDTSLDIVMALAFGVGAGAQTVTRPMYVTDLYGTVGFGRTFGRISRIGRFSMALAPGLVGVLVTLTGGYSIAWTAMAIGSLLAARTLPRGARTM